MKLLLTLLLATASAFAGEPQNGGDRLGSHASLPMSSQAVDQIRTATEVDIQRLEILCKKLSRQLSNPSAFAKSLEVANEADLLLKALLAEKGEAVHRLEVAKATGSQAPLAPLSRQIADCEAKLNQRCQGVLSGLKTRLEAKRTQRTALRDEFHLSLPVLKVDDAHYASLHENEHPQRYRIRPSDGVVIDASGYVFKGNPPLRTGGTVDRVVLTRQRPAGRLQLQSPWPPGGDRQELSARTVQPQESSEVFMGFKSGERWFVFVGKAEDGTVVAVWSGVIEVD